MVLTATHKLRDESTLDENYTENLFARAQSNRKRRNFRRNREQRHRYELHYTSDATHYRGGWAFIDMKQKYIDIAGRFEASAQNTNSRAEHFSLYMKLRDGGSAGGR